MVTKFKDFHNRGMALHGNYFDTTATIRYTESNVIKQFIVKCTINGLGDADVATGKYSSTTTYFTFRIDDLKSAIEIKTKKTGCIIRGFIGKDVIFNGKTYSVEAENPNGSTQDCIVLRGIING